MNFTREPIIETIISAKEGYKLSLKSSKSKGDEEFLVDAIEVVSYGGTFFYRSKEKPKPFFLPATDYEIIEVRETRLLLKTTNIEKSIKIAGGSKQDTSQEKNSVKAKSNKKETEAKVAKGEQKKEKKKSRRSKKSTETPPAAEKKTAKKEEATQEVVQPSVFSHLLQPPTSLISDSIHKYKKDEEDKVQISEEIVSTISLEATQEGIEPKPDMKMDRVDDTEVPPREEVVPEPRGLDEELVSEKPKPGEKLEEPPAEKLSQKEETKEPSEPLSIDTSE